MEFYADIADVNQIEQLQKWLPLDGVTTNPTIVAKEQTELFELIDKLLDCCNGLVHVQILGRDTTSIVADAHRLNNIAPDRIIPKIPVTQGGLGAVMQLSKEQIRTTVTGVFSVNQAVMAAKAGATYVAPYVNRVDNMEQSGVKVVREIKAAFDHYGFTAKILAASVKSSLQLKELIALGTHAVTIPPETYLQALSHPLTDQAIAQFESDWNRVFAKLALDSQLG